MQKVTLLIGIKEQHIDQCEWREEQGFDRQADGCINLGQLRSRP